MAKKNSLVENINRRKKSGTSRPKKKSTVSKKAYEDMEKGWPAKAKKSARTVGRKNPLRYFATPMYDSCLPGTAFLLRSDS